MIAPVGNWSVVKTDVVATTFQGSREELPVRAYSPVKQRFTLALECFGGLIERLFLFLQQQTQKKAEGQIVIAVPIDTTVENFRIYSAQIMNLAKHFQQETKERKSTGKESEKSIAESVPLRFGLGAQEQVECVKKAQEIAIQWFTKRSEVLPMAANRKCWMAPIDNILTNTWHFDPEMQRFFYKEFKLRSSKEPTAFTKADLTAFDIKDGEKTANPTKMNCVAFAFLKARELRAKEYIFQGKEFPMKDLALILKTWGYVPIETPAPHDLVMYVDSEDNPTHLGRFLISGQIESKLGINQPYFFWHNIFDVPANYGHRVIFMRKT